MLNRIKPVLISGKEVLPIIEGGKGIGVSNGATSGAFAASGATGTFSGVNADRYDDQGNLKPTTYKGTTRKEKHEELIQMGIEGGITQAKIAYEASNGNGRIHVNVLWEMGGAESILEGILEGTKGLVNGVTCGAGMPYRVAEIAEKYNVYYYPIVSSMRAFRALWKRSYHKSSRLLGGVVYEDPWLAGGHNGLSNSENPHVPENPMPRVIEIRKFMNEVGLTDTPIIMAGGVWHLNEWSDWLDNPEIGNIAFQFGTRPILTQESPVSTAWKKKLLTLKQGDIFLNQFSPTGFYSSAVRNDFIDELDARAKRQVAYVSKANEEFSYELKIGARGRSVFIKPENAANVNEWVNQGFDEAMRTPDDTLIFVTKDKAQQLLHDQIDCMGCLSACRFSNWCDKEDLNYTTGKKADPRSFCIQKTLQKAIHGEDIENQLMFSGHNAYRFATDPFYSNGFVPTVKQLVDRIMTGE
ncbi:NAD(P)H-dependent flavin oxidoreductase [Rickettsiales endosymbiont of Stachyamoeba lipophora]|uniref:NAD(P)H-dependent flavin oxidoreductase n=1 Tax=Rickettsiales endosymbiont of Stachyamoeba lipophora TaxID=2486578 RepID=UPI0019CFBBE0|nr:nitronate monooxygenase [Rickettsiales endosymbiont of Stachyamoeba lipophora]